MALPGSQETMPPNSGLRLLERVKIAELSLSLSHIQDSRLGAGEQRSLLLQHAVKVEAVVAKLRESALVEAVRDRICWDAKPKSFVCGVQAETARLEAEVEKFRKEVETAQAWAEPGWAETETVLKEVETVTKAALRRIKEVARVRVETERVHKLGGKTKAETEKTSEEEEARNDSAQMDSETEGLLWELERITYQYKKMQYKTFRAIAETDRLAVVAKKLRVEVDLVVCMTKEDWQKVVRD